MTLAPGTRLGSYEILAPLGAGGMGEVYRARDTKLGREVAIKTLPEALAANAERLARFRREAQVLASLNHPHVATIHGLEEAGSVEALILELVEGESLAERIARGAIPPEEAIPIALQIAEALEYAHERGIVHRDLKPSNVMITPNGKVKLLDFGLAKALEGRGGPDASGSGADASRSPTITAAATQEGVVIGTAAYMSPEQARGKAVDKRADIWAFGCVLYEMLTGRKAFQGASVTETLAALIRDEPDWKSLPRATPASVRRLIERCLAKEPTRRLQAIGDARVDLEEEASVTGAAPRTGARPAVRRGLSREIVLVGAALVVIAGALLWYLSSGSKAQPAASASGASPAATAPVERSIAVLPFRNLSGDPGNDYFSDGMSEEILNALTRLPGLKVIGRTSSFRFRGPDVDVAAVGKQLEVGTILAGSVQRQGDSVRVTAELVDTRTGFQLWSQKYDRKIQNLFELEDEISRAIADALRVQLAGGGQLVTASTANPEAHNLALRANALTRRSDEASLLEAIRLYREALAADPRYARAWAGLADAYIWLADAYRAPSEVVPLAKQAAKQAVSIDDSLASGHLELGMVYLLWDWEYATARRELERSLALDPGVGFTHAAYSLLIGAADRDPGRARAELQKAAALDPLNPYIPWLEVPVALGQRRYEEALSIAARGRSIDPDFFYFMDSTATVHMAMGRWADCVRDQNELPESIRAQPQYGLAICSWHVGDQKTARGILERLEAVSRERYVDATTIGSIYAAMGRKDEAFSWFDRALRDRSARLPFIEYWPEFDPARSDPRYPKLLEKIGLSAEKR